MKEYSTPITWMHTVNKISEMAPAQNLDYGEKEVPSS